VIELRQVSKTYQRGDRTPVTALRDLSFSIRGGEFVTIRGASGSGKSSVLNILGCLDTPTSGTYLLGGDDVSGYSDRQRSRVRNTRIGFVFQSFNLLARTTALENVEMPMVYNAGSVDRRQAQAALDRVGLTARANHFATELSGGEQQRVAIARALINDPPLLLADEPTGNLDSVAGDAIMALLTALHREGRTIVLVTHDERVAACAERELFLRDGALAWDTLAGATS
jgi:putative ABC transport system ATP-binding protein